MQKSYEVTFCLHSVLYSLRVSPRTWLIDPGRPWQSGYHVYAPRLRKSGLPSNMLVLGFLYESYVLCWGCIGKFLCTGTSLGLCFYLLSYFILTIIYNVTIQLFQLLSIIVIIHYIQKHIPDHSCIFHPHYHRICYFYVYWRYTLGCTFTQVWITIFWKFVSGVMEINVSSLL